MERMIQDLSEELPTFCPTDRLLRRRRARRPRQQAQAARPTAPPVTTAYSRCLRYYLLAALAEHSLCSYLCREACTSLEEGLYQQGSWVVVHAGAPASRAHRCFVPVIISAFDDGRPRLAAMDTVPEEGAAVGL